MTNPKEFMAIKEMQQQSFLTSYQKNQEMIVSD